MEDFLQGLIQSGLTGNKPQVPLGQPQPQQGGLGQVAKQPAISPEDMLGKEQARLTGDDELSALAKVRDSSKQKLVDELMKQSEYSGLDKIAAGFRGINLGRVPKGMSSLAFAANGMGDAAGKFAELKDKYKQTALELQATAAQKAYDDQWAQEKQARQNMAAERRASLANETKETIAKAKALAASGRVPPNTMAKLIADAETAVQNDFANGRITNDATERQMTKDKYIAEGIKRILGDEWVNTALPGQPPASTAPAQSASTPEQGAGFQGDPNTIMKELARIPNEEDKIAAGQQYEQQLNTPPVPPAQSATGQVTQPQAPGTPRVALTKQQLELASKVNASKTPGTTEYADAQKEIDRQALLDSESRLKGEGFKNTKNTITNAVTNLVGYSLVDASGHPIDLTKGKPKSSFSNATGPVESQDWVQGIKAFSPFTTGISSAKANLKQIKELMETEGLQKLKATGVAPGSVTEAEWSKFASMFSAIDAAMDEPQLLKAIQDMQLQYNVVMDTAAREAAKYNASRGHAAETTSYTPNTSAPAVDNDPAGIRHLLTKPAKTKG